MSFHEILIPIVVAAIPCAGLLLSKRFEFMASKSNKTNERFEALEKRISQNELRVERVLGRLNGLDRDEKS